MRNLKKFLALVLAMMMCFSLMITANAATGSFSDSEKVTAEFQEAVEVLAGMGVLKGVEDGSNFDPSGTIDRAQAATIIYRLHTGDVEGKRAGLYVNEASDKFVDVDPSDWFAGYVGYCANHGIILGDGAGHFNPNDKIDGYQILALLERVIGYKDDTVFPGSDWRIRVASGATQLGILNTVNTTNYGGSLHKSTRRDVVASMIFRAIQLPQFINGTTSYWTAENGNLTVKENDTLAWKWFGLTSVTGIVVGNKATGEDDTLVGVELKKLAQDGDPQELGNGVSYDYDSTPATTSDAGNVSLAFAGDTGLDVFGHKVTVWYDANSATGKDDTVDDIDTGFTTIYVMFDEAVATATVQATATTLSGDTGDLVAKAKASDGFAKDPGKNRDTSGDNETNDVYFSDKYGQMALAEDGSVGTSSIRVYRLISNDNGKLDVVIALEGLVGQINKVDTTSGKPSVTVKDSGYGDSDVIDVKSLTASSCKKLGAIVEAWEVEGTNEDNDNLPYYQLDEVTEKVTKTVSTYSTTSGNVVCTDGTTLKASWLYNKVINGVAQQSNYTTSAYVFTMDSMGRYLGARPVNEESFFLYATYADFKYGEVGSGDMEYMISGVKWDGEIVLNHKLTKVGPNANSLANMDGQKYNEDLGVSRRDYASGTGGQVLLGSYTPFTLNSKGEAISGGGTKITTDWTIKKSDVSNGFADVLDDRTLLVTPSTKFIVVEGTGSSTLKREIYNSMSEFLNGADEVIITADYTNADTEQVYSSYYRTSAEKYSNVNTSGNNTVDTVIVPKAAINRTSSTSLLYCNGNAATGVKIAATTGDYTVDQYKLWEDGESKYYFIATDGGDGCIAPEEGTFYTKTLLGEYGGQPVYKLNPGSKNAGAGDSRINGGSYWAKQKLAYNATSDLSTITIGDVVYSATEARVVDITNNIGTGAGKHAEFKTVRDLKDAISSKAYDDIYLSITNTGAKANIIYVTSVTFIDAE